MSESRKYNWKFNWPVEWSFDCVLFAILIVAIHLTLLPIVYCALPVVMPGMGTFGTNAVYVYASACCVMSSLYHSTKVIR